MIPIKYTDTEIIESVLSHKSIRESAKALGITAQALYNRIKRPKVAQALKEQREQGFKVASIKLANSIDIATNTLIELIESQSTPPGVKANCCKIILDTALKVTEQQDIIQKIQAIENSLNINTNLI